MLWILYALLSALSKSLLDLFSKRLMQDNKDEYIITWARFAFSVPILVFFLFFFGIPKTDSTLWLVILIGAPIEVIAIILYIHSIKISPLSLTIPILGLTPVFIILSSYLMLKELPSFTGLVGILTIVIGTYILGMNSGNKGFFAPFRNIFREKGPLLMLFVAFIFCITPNLGKIGILHSSIFFFMLILFSSMLLLYTPIIFLKSRKHLYQIKNNIYNFFLIGIFELSEISFALLAFQSVFVNYAVSLKRASILFSVIFGFIILKEKNVRERLLGAVVITIGIILISLA